MTQRETDNLVKSEAETAAEGKPFKFYAPLTFFEKADAPEAQKRRIAGIVSTESRDRQGEVILQRGLDFSEFMEHGWYNSNHGKDPDKVLGYPEEVKFFQKGEKLPDGTTAPTNLHWAEGYLIPGYAPADRIWELGTALAKGNHKRRLGYSIEGSILRRQDHDHKTIAKAKVRNVAITHCPVNADTSLIALAKSLEQEEREEFEQEEKALSTTSGAALMPESLEQSPKKRPKMLTKSEAIAWLQNKQPHLSRAMAERVVQLTAQLREQGFLRGE